MIEAVLVILLGGAALGFSTWDSRKRSRFWQDAAVSCGLQAVELSFAGYPRLKARAGPMEVRITTLGDKRTRIVIQAPWPPEFQSVSIGTGLDSAVEIEVGDKRFDDIFFIGGPSNLVLALLDAETRRLLFNVNLDGKLDISRGELRLVQMSDENVPHALPLLLGVGRRFAQPLDIPRRLAENAQQDPMPWVRLQNLRLLIRELPDDPATGEVLRKACSDAVPEIRLQAAKQLGAEGRGVVLELAEGLLDDAVSAEAILILEPELPFERMRAIFERALSQRKIRAACSCLEAIGRGRDSAAVDLLAKVLESEHAGLAPTAAWALGITGSPASEPPLIAALQREEENLRVVAAQALGRVGSVAAVLPLKELADRFLLGETRKAARQAVAEIQSRVQGASPGQLSLAGAEAGQLSLATDPAGQLSIPPEERPE